MAQETNSGFTLPAQADAVASNVVNNISNTAEQVVMDVIPITTTTTSTRDMLIGGAVLVVLFVIFFFIKNFWANNLVKEKVSPSNAEASGWGLFLLLATLSTVAVLLVINTTKFFTLLAMGPAAVLTILFIVVIFVFKNK